MARQSRRRTISREAEIGDTAARLREAGVTLELGGILRDISRAGFDRGKPGRSGESSGARTGARAGIPVWSEIELAWRYLRGKLVAITGSNGKTTTTSLVAHILKTADIPTLVGGNIGVPLLSLVERSTDATVTVAEISSFQLETDRSIPSRDWRAVESDAGPSRSPRDV